MSEAKERDYVLGTDDPEVARLGVQHQVWRERTFNAFRRAGAPRGATVIDVGCGPGYVALDLAEQVGPEGRVIAVDRSRRFLDVLDQAARARGLGNIEIVEADIDEWAPPQGVADLVWARWLLIFAPDPEGAVARFARALKPGGALVSQEYVDYDTWAFIPPSQAHDAFRAAVMESWRAHGGDPNVARRLPAAVAAAGLTAEAMEPLVYAVRGDDFMWNWVSSYIETGPRRLVELGFLDAGQADAVRADWAARRADPSALMITPMVLEIIARAPR